MLNIQRYVPTVRAVIYDGTNGADFAALTWIHAFSVISEEDGILTIFLDTGDNPQELTVNTGDYVSLVDMAIWGSTGFSFAGLLPAELFLMQYALVSEV